MGFIQWIKKKKEGSLNQHKKHSRELMLSYGIRRMPRSQNENERNEGNSTRLAVYRLGPHNSIKSSLDATLQSLYTIRLGWSKR